MSASLTEKFPWDVVQHMILEGYIILDLNTTGGTEEEFVRVDVIPLKVLFVIVDGSTELPANFTVHSFLGERESFVVHAYMLFETGFRREMFLADVALVTEKF